MARTPNPRATKLTAEERRLAREQEQLRRREEQLQRELLQLPAKIEQRRERERRVAKLRAELAAPAISLGSARGSRSSRADRRPRRLPTGELHGAQVKFLVLILIFASLVFLLWRSLPG